MSTLAHLILCNPMASKLGAEQQHVRRTRTNLDTMRNGLPSRRHSSHVVIYLDGDRGAGRPSLAWQSFNRTSVFQVDASELDVGNNADGSEDQMKARIRLAGNGRTGVEPHLPVAVKRSVQIGESGAANRRQRGSLFRRTVESVGFALAVENDIEVPAKECGLRSVVLLEDDLPQTSQPLHFGFD